MGFRNFRFNLFIFLINILEIMLHYLIVTQATHYYIITVVRTSLNNFTVADAEGSIVSAEKYFIIKRTLFTLKKSL